MNDFQKIVDSVRTLGAEGEKLADEFNDLSYCDLLQVIVDDSDIEQALAALDLMVPEGVEPLMAILERWKANYDATAAIERARVDTENYEAAKA